ncbi:MAG: hypothetical protein R6U31_04670 [bacterium]
MTEIFAAASLILLVLIFIRRKRRRFFLSLFLLVLVFIILIMPRFLNSTRRSIIIDSGALSYNTLFDSISKTEMVKEKYGKHYPVTVSDRPGYDDPSKIVFSDSKGYDIRIDRDDMGIDTVHYTNDSTIVIVRNYSGPFRQCSLRAMGEDTIVMPADSAVRLYGQYESIFLMSDDSNDFNEYFYRDNKPEIMFIDTVYSTALQKKSRLFSGLFDDYTFISGIYRDGDIVSITDNPDACISIAGSIDIADEIPCIVVEGDNESDILKVEHFLASGQPGRKRIKNPFNSSRPSFSRPVSERAADFFANTLTRIMLVILIAVVMILLF